MMLFLINRLQASGEVFFKSYFLLFLFGLRELTGVADSHGACEAVGQLDPVGLFFDGLP